MEGGKGAHGGLRFCCLSASQRDFFFLNEVVIKVMRVFFSMLSGFDQTEHGGKDSRSFAFL